MHGGGGIMKKRVLIFLALLGTVGSAFCGKHDGVKTEILYQSPFKKLLGPLVPEKVSGLSFQAASSAQPHQAEVGESALPEEQEEPEVPAQETVDINTRLNEIRQSVQRYYDSLLDDFPSLLSDERTMIEKRLELFRANVELIEFSKEVELFCAGFESKSIEEKYRAVDSWQKLFIKCHKDIATLAINTTQHRFDCSRQRDALLTVYKEFIKQVEEDDAARKVIMQLCLEDACTNLELEPDELSEATFVSTILSRLSDAPMATSKADRFAGATSLMWINEMVLNNLSTDVQQMELEHYINQTLEDTGFTQETLLKLSPTENLPWAFALPKEQKNAAGGLGQNGKKEEFFTPGRARMLFAANAVGLGVYLLHKIGLFRMIVRWYDGPPTYVTILPAMQEHERLYENVLAELKEQFSRLHGQDESATV